MKTRRLGPVSYTLLLSGLLCTTLQPSALPAQAAPVVPKPPIRNAAAGAAATPTPTPVLNLDFEDGLKGWTKTGRAFDWQPLANDAATGADVKKITVGGDYWKRIPYPVGHSKWFWIGTKWRSSGRGGAVSQGDGPTGTLTSQAFKIIPAMRFLSFLIGGTKDVLNQRIELQIEGTPASVWLPMAAMDSSVPSKIAVDGKFAIVYAATGTGSEELVQRVVAIPPALVGRNARLRIVDSSATGHINVDAFALGAKPAAPGPRQIWGFADTHTHPMGHIGFGGLKGIRTIWGAPGTSYADYLKDPGLIRRDLPACNATHLGGRASPWFVNGLEGSLPDFFVLFMSPLGKSHSRNGPDKGGVTEYKDWPNFAHGAHAQHHVTGIRRAYEGGLRLMSWLVVNNEMAEYFMSRVQPAKTVPAKITRTAELDIIQASVCGFQQLARMNSDWMEIAYSPEDARRIIGRNKLAVVLGVELDRLGSLSEGASMADEIDTLYRLGIRQVTPIHAIDNVLGGPAIAQDGYNTQNFHVNNKWYEIDTERACGKGAPWGDCVTYSLNTEVTIANISRSVELYAGEKAGPGQAIGSLVGSLGIDYGLTEIHPWRDTCYAGNKCDSKNEYTGRVNSRAPGTYWDRSGHANKKGLTEQGQQYLQAAMKRGMLIDLAHMSDRMASAALGESKKTRDYPVMISHAGFRALKLAKDYSEKKYGLIDACKKMGTANLASQCKKEVMKRLTEKKLLTSTGNIRPGSINRGYVASEFDTPDYQIRAVTTQGGIIGAFISAEPMDNSTFKPGIFDNDCAMSSKGFATSYLYGLSQMDAHFPKDAHGKTLRSLALATDFGLRMTTTPRFGQQSVACGADRKSAPFDRPDSRMVERILQPGQYEISAQKHGIVYEGKPEHPAVIGKYGKNAPLKPYKLGKRLTDFNVEGLSSYGMLPDQLQDMTNFSKGKIDLGPLFNSAEAYVRMWEKAWKAGQCTREQCAEAKNLPPFDCGKACRGLCPNSFNAGAPLTPWGQTVWRCSEKNLKIGGTTILGSAKNDAVLNIGEWAIYRISNGSKIQWACGDTTETASNECPPGTRYLKVFRGVPTSPKGNAVHVDCLAPPLL